MKKLIFAILASISMAAFAGPFYKVPVQEVQMVFVPLMKYCEVYYSLYPPGQVCIKGQLYFRAYDVKYSLGGSEKQVKISFHPGDVLSVSKDGVVEPRNFSTKSEFE